MLKNVTHAGGINAAESTEPPEEILFNTPFNYLFPELVEKSENKLPVAASTIDALNKLGNAMADPGKPDQEIKELNSNIPSIFTYLGQFIDHDITARTDRETDISTISDENDSVKEGLKPASPQEIVKNLKNGRRPYLDLDSVYGDGPTLISNSPAGARTEADFLYEDGNLLLKLQEDGDLVDVPRNGREAAIADMRNDENVIVSQLQAVFIKFHNVIASGLPANVYPSPQKRYLKARQLVRWAYQYIVINEYLKAVCEPNIVENILFNGPFFYRPGIIGEAFMPLEFSVAGFRFGHSMIRPFYQLNRQTEETVMNLLGVSKNREPDQDLLEKVNGKYRLKKAFAVEWNNFIPFANGEPIPNFARKIDPKIAKGLFNLQLEGAGPNTFFSHLAQRNLVRGYSLSLPTGQAVAKAFGLEPLTKETLIDQESDQELKKALEEGNFGNHTPLWYYLLKESALQTDGNALGAVGSNIVAETLVGLVKADPNSYLNNFQDPAVQPDGIHIKTKTGEKAVISTIGDIISFAGVRMRGTPAPMENPGQGPPGNRGQGRPSPA